PRISPLSLHDALPICVPPSRELRAPGSPASSPIAHPRRHIENLRHELTATKEFLQSIIEEREAANQELQAANEELLSSNEELQRDRKSTRLNSSLGSI